MQPDTSLFRVLAADQLNGGYSLFAGTDVAELKQWFCRKGAVSLQGFSGDVEKSVPFLEVQQRKGYSVSQNLSFYLGRTSSTVPLGWSNSRCDEVILSVTQWDLMGH